MDKVRIQKAAQLQDDLKKVNKALGLFDSQKVAVRLSAKVGGNDSETFLPIYRIVWLQQSIICLLPRRSQSLEKWRIYNMKKRRTTPVTEAL